VAVYQLGTHLPQIDPSAWIADSAAVIGQVTLGADCSVWFGAVLRADNDRIVIGRGSNVQDGSVLHTDEGIAVVLGEHVLVGHQCMLHGCEVGDGSLVGIQAVILNGARIGRNCLVGAGSLVTEGKVFPDNSLIMGSPAKVVREMAPEQIAQMRRGAPHYVQQAQRYREQLRRIDA
jgi:carbonic anhydrase/acetyltransferase-like protein (isoleucine patch superfamily)